MDGERGLYGLADIERSDAQRRIEALNAETEAALSELEQGIRGRLLNTESTAWALRDLDLLEVARDEAVRYRDQWRLRSAIGLRPGGRRL